MQLGHTEEGLSEILRCRTELVQTGQAVIALWLFEALADVYLAAGCYISNELTGPDNKIIPGADYKGVQHGINLLAKTNYGEPAFIGKKVIVLGGGFTAMDCSRSSVSPARRPISARANG